MQSENIDLAEIENLEIDGNLTVIDRIKQFLIKVNNPYEIKVNDTKVKVVFSRKKNAPEIERLLVKIASNRGK